MSRMGQPTAQLPAEITSALRAGGFEELTTTRRLAFAVVTLPGRLFVAWLRAVATIVGART